MGERIARDYKLRQLNLRIADDRWIDRQNRRFVAGKSKRLRRHGRDMRRHRDFCRGQYSPIGQESKEELAGVYRLDTAGKAARIRRRQKSEVGMQKSE